MTLPELVALLDSAGVAWGLAPTPGRLRIDAPAGALAPEAIAALGEHKPALLELARRRAGQGPIGPAPNPEADPIAARIRADLDERMDRPPKRTAWGTLAWSAPDAPPLDAFGPPLILLAPALRNG